MGKLRDWGINRYVPALVAVFAVESLIWKWPEPEICPAVLAAIMVGAWCGGMGPAVLAAVLGIVISEWAPATHSGHILSGSLHTADVLRLSTYLMTAALIGGLQKSRQRERRAYESCRELFYQFLDNIPMAAYIKDGEGRYLFMNHQVERIFGMTAGAWRGKTDGELFAAELAKKYAEDDAKVLAGAAPLELHETVLTEKEPHHYVVCKFAFTDSRGNRFLAGAALDETAAKRGEAERNRLLERLEAASAAKDRFLAMLSHELRTPLTPALLALSMLAQCDRLSEEARSWVASIHRNVELESQLIDDLLDVTRISAGKLPIFLELTDVHQVVGEALEVCRLEAEAKRLQLEVRLEAGLSQVEADPARLRQIFWNLLKNAVKFTPEGGSVTVWSYNSAECTVLSAEPAEHSALSTQDSGLVVEVSDTGIGIEAELLPRLFDPFEQGGREVTQRFGGLGLGLTITKALVEAHRGRISASSAGRGLGATFRVELPARKLPKALTRPAAGPASARQELRLHVNGREMRVLLVEDNTDTARMLGQLLSSYECKVRIAGCVGSALGAAAEEGFDLMISDIGLPDGSGLDLMRELRQRGEIAGIALSGYGTVADVQRSREAGFLEHLVKPIDMGRLEAALRKAKAHVELRVGKMAGVSDGAIVSSHKHPE